ncbi:MAG: VanZ family protein [Thiogranum sp.]|nr:VanZ family protein [Thiogranum sp.]
MALLFYLSHQTGLDLPSLFSWQDKLFHACAYAVLSGLLLAGHPLPDGGYTWRQAGISALIASLYGISDELHQALVPGRSSDVLDWLADTTGALLAVIVLVWLSRLLPAARRQPDNS